MIKIPTIKIDTVKAEPKKPKRLGYAILVEKRYPKVKTDQNKLFGTKPNHKYY